MDSHLHAHHTTLETRKNMGLVFMVQLEQCVHIKSTSSVPTDSRLWIDAYTHIIQPWKCASTWDGFLWFNSNYVFIFKKTLLLYWLTLDQGFTPTCIHHTFLKTPIRYNICLHKIRNKRTLTLSNFVLSWCILDFFCS